MDKNNLIEELQWEIWGLESEIKDAEEYSDRIESETGKPYYETIWLLKDEVARLLLQIKEISSKI